MKKRLHRQAQVLFYTISELDPFEKVMIALIGLCMIVLISLLLFTFIWWLVA